MTSPGVLTSAAARAAALTSKDGERAMSVPSASHSSKYSGAAASAYSGMCALWNSNSTSPPSSSVSATSARALASRPRSNSRWSHTATVHVSAKPATRQRRTPPPTRDTNRRARSDRSLLDEIPESPLRAQDRRLAPHVNLAAQAGHEDLDRIARHVRHAVVKMRDELVMGEHAARLVGEEFQQTIFGGRQMYHAAAPGHALARGVDLERAHAKGR